jgi:hypothetical protein
VSEEDAIYVIGNDEQSDRWLWSRDAMEISRKPLETDQLRQELARFAAKLDTILGAIPDAIGQLSLDTITVSAEISAKGTISLLGVGGGELAGKGGISFTLKRRPE